MRACFNCGKSFASLPQNERTKDHIPPQCLFDDFPEAFKTNRKTVPCCLACNNSFSTLDEMFRNVLGFGFDMKHGNKEITKKSVAKLFKDGKITLIDGAVSIEVSRDDIHAFLKRCFKAVYYKKYSEVFPENNFDILIIDEHESQDKIDYALDMHQFVTTNQGWEISGSSNVFEYSVKRIDFDKQDEMIVAPTINEAKLVAAAMTFVENYAAVVIAKRR